MKYTIIFTFVFLALFACNHEEQKSSAPIINDNDSLEELNLKLDATEAQLYNVRVELAKCKGDSLPDVEKP